MTNSYLGPLTGGRKIILLGIAAGIACMLVASVIYRSSNPSLTKQARRPAPPQSQQGSPMAGVGMLMQQLQNDPQNIEILLKLGRSFAEKEDWDKAENFLKKAVTVAPTNPEVLYLLGVAQFKHGHAEDAVKTFETLVSVQEDPHARFNMGILYKHYLNNMEMANKHLKALIADPNAPQPLKEKAQEELAAKAHGSND